MIEDLRPISIKEGLRMELTFESGKVYVVPVIGWARDDDWGWLPAFVPNEDGEVVVRLHGAKQRLILPGK